MIKGLQVRYKQIIIDSLCVTEEDDILIIPQHHHNTKIITFLVLVIAVSI